MRLLVTGGAGFIGSNFIHYMLAKYTDIQITVLDNLTYAGNLQNLTPHLEDHRLRFVQGSINDLQVVSKETRQKDYLINFASESHVDRSIGDASPFIKTNLDGVRVLLDAQREHPSSVFIQISTDEVYGASDDGVYRSVNACLNPGNPYAASKAAADLMIGAYANTFGTNHRIIRLTNNYGPRQHVEKLIPKVITAFQNKECIPIYGDGMQSRDWLYVHDSCRAIETVMLCGQNGSIYNASTQKSTPNLEIVQKIGSKMNGDLKLLKHVADRPGHDSCYLINSHDITALGWKPMVPLEAGLAKTIYWYLQK